MFLRFAFALALLAPGFAQAQARLFTAVDASRATLTVRQAELLEHTEALVAATDVRLAEANPSALTEAEVTFDLAPDASVTLVLDRTERPATGRTFFFRGADAGTHAIVVEREGLLTGTVRLGGQLYSIRPLTGTLHAIVRMDEGRFTDHPADWEAVEHAAAERYEAHPVELERAPETPRGGAIIQRVLVPYTPRAVAEVGDILGLVQLAMAETNQGYADSEVNIRLELAYTYLTPQNGSNNFSTTLARMINPNDGFHDEIPGLRAQYGADMVGIIVGQNSSLCGRANAILADGPDDAFQVTSQSCATGYYSFAHEFGHLQGARHNVEIDNSSLPFPYGHGKCYSPGNWRTVMSYGCPGSTSRVARWSNPDVNFNGAPLGDTSLRDNARVLDETGATIAAFFADPAAASVTGTVTSGGTVATGGGTVTFDLSFTNPATSTFNGEYWVDVFLPNGRLFNGSPIERSPLSLGAGQSTTLSFSGTVPARAPSGTYTLRGYIGTSYPNGVTDSDDFTFTKTGSLAKGGDFQLDFNLVPAADELSAASRPSGAVTGMLATYPNPFNPQTTLRYQVAERTPLRLAVYDVLGRQVATLADGTHEAGTHEVVFAAESLPSGVYVWRLVAGTSTETGRLLLVK